MVDVSILETADHLHDRVYFANMTEELVAEPFARTRALHKPRYVHEFDRGRYYFLRMRKLREDFEAGIRHTDDAEIRIDRAERVIGGLRFSSARDGIKQRRLSDVWQTDDSGAQHRRGG